MSTEPAAAHGSIPIPEVIRNINSFTLGARSVNPKVKTRVVWVNEWFNLGERAATLYFAPYHVGPYVVGPQVIDLPYADLRPLLRPEMLEAFQLA